MKKFLFLLLWLMPLISLAATCQKVSETCVDGPSTKTISGVAVTRNCWQYQDVYQCTQPASTNYCSGLASASGCSQTGSQCSDTAFNGTCNTYTNTYGCTTQQPAQTGVTQLATTYQIVSDVIDDSACNTYKNNSSCTLQSHTCVDGPSTKNINGLDVNKSCWQWQNTYQCVSVSSTDYCAPLESTAGCTMTNQTCTSTNADGTCAQYTRNYSCGTSTSGTNITQLNSSYTITSNTLDTSQCTSLANASNCTIVDQTCTDGPGYKTINGMQVYQDCWAYSYTYACAGSSLQSDCQPLTDKGCSLQTTSCINTNNQGTCTAYQKTYQCQSAPPKSNTVTDCGTQTFCSDGQCFNSGSKPDQDFGQAVAGLELQREFGKYMEADGTIFKGFNNTCDKKLGGLVNCCSTSPGSGQGASNMALMMQSGYQAASGVYSAIGSSYTYDALLQSEAPDWVQLGFQSMFGSGGQTSVLASFIAGDATTEEFLNALAPGWFTVAMLVIQYSGILSCPEDSQTLAMKRDNNLCHMVGSYCSAKIPIIGTCIQTTESYCCYNSKLSKIINEQGRPQLGKSYGTPEHTDCSGFTPQELQKIDFSKIDLSEFIKDITPQLPAQSDQAQLIQNKVNNYYAQ